MINYYIQFKTIIVIPLLLLTSCLKVNEDCNQNRYTETPEKEWFRDFGGSEEEAHGHFILSCSDGGYLQIGETGSLPNSAKILIVKINSSGDLIWKKEFSDGGHNLGNSAIETEDGYIVCGALNKNSTIFKLDKNNGSEIFRESVDNGGNDAFEHLAITSSGIVAVGYTDATENNNTFYTGGKGYITFLDFNGVKKNGVNISSYLSHAYRVKVYNEKLYLSGLTDGANDYGLMKVDQSGNILWFKTFGGTNQDHCFGMDQNPEGFIFLTGHTISGTENWDSYTMKIDTNGNQIWEDIAGNPRGFKPKYIHDEAWGVRATQDGGCLMVAGSGDEYVRYSRRCGQNKMSSNDWQVYLIKYTSNGTVAWEKTFGDGKNVDWAGEDLDLTSDGGAIVAVDNGKFGFLKIKPF